MENSEIITAVTSLRDAAIALLARLTPEPAKQPPVITTPAYAGRVPENPTGTVAGLTYAYYEGPTAQPWTKIPDFSTLKPLSGGISPLPVARIAAARADFYALHYAGFLAIPADGEYTFYLNSDDGARLYIGTTLVVDNDGGHSVQEKWGTIKLQKGVHALTLDYFEYNGAEVLTVSYSATGLAKTAIPAAAYSCVAPAATTTPATPTTTASKPAVDNLTAKLP